ncbi:tetratricopeptide repeat protein [Helicobacter cappadocius]|uniref:CDC27 family protein n=1 Tax=Helicobacter cappadocius TaxID=3063998 RepID=A0AA90PSP8_9HELI|nr:MULTISPECIES: CDC27 family protein [unclassified Helicobacter]MDO7253120.1 CDC27 family protein [Helicobacter sp. faydin-H75]MDP2538754.1 CDC27 family protein [Helicobacter sp. faydin-H76]
MKNLFIVIVIGIIFLSCSSKKPDFFGDEVYQERILLVAKNYKDLIRIYREKLEKKDTPQNRLKLAQYYYEAQDYSSVFYYLQPLIQSKNSPEALLLYSKALETTRKYKEALQMLEELTVLDKNIAQAYNLKGIVYASLKKFGPAKQNFLRAKELFLNDSIVNTNLGMLAILEQKYTEAINYLMPLYKRGYKDTKILNNLIFALVKANRLDIALEIIQKENISKSPRNFVRNLQRIKANPL